MSDCQLEGQSGLVSVVSAWCPMFSYRQETLLLRCINELNGEKLQARGNPTMFFVMIFTCMKFCKRQRVQYLRDIAVDNVFGNPNMNWMPLIMIPL